MQLLFRRCQAPISMWICAGLASAEFAFFSRFSATGGTTNVHGLLLLGFHIPIMQNCKSAG